jgi:hypothetical protein
VLLAMGTVGLLVTSVGARRAHCDVEGARLLSNDDLHARPLTATSSPETKPAQ